ncbi:hypothetical protein HZA98_04585 [Candidatus Woesearchaeota archaeon]|nr:hypothetical protein [Candidatus Woesearchaeota archaeon]
MKKEVVRKQAIRLRFRYKSYAVIQRILKERYSFVASRRTLKRWWHRFNAGDWDFRDISRKPKRVKYKFSQEEIDEILFLRKQEGCSAYQIKYMLERKGFYMSESFIKSIIRNVGLSRGNKMEGQRLKWVRFERLHPNSMWQIDGTQYKGRWIIPVIDDCSRYCIIIGVFEQNTTKKSLLC